MIIPYLAIGLLILTTGYAAIVSFRGRPDASTWLFPQGSSRPVRISVGIATVILIIGLIAWFSVTAHKSTRISSRFLIPEGYTGWVRVEFDVQGAPPLPVENGETIVRIPSDALLRTSSSEQYGWANDSYYSYSATASHRLKDSGPDSLIWGRINGESSGTSGKKTYEEFFVGSNQQFKEQSK